MDFLLPIHRMLIKLRNQCKFLTIGKEMSHSFSSSRTIVVQNPFDDPSNSVKYHHDASSESHNLIGQHSGHYDHFTGISNPLIKQSDLQSTTSLIPIPSSLSHNLGVQHHSITQPSLTPTMIRPYPASYSHYHQGTPPGMYLNNVRPMVGKLHQPTRPSNGTSPTIVRFPATQQYGHQMMKPRMISPNTYGPSQTPVIYDPNGVYRTNGQQPHHVPLDDNILKSLLQINPQMVNPVRLNCSSSIHSSRIRMYRSNLDQRIHLNQTFSKDVKNVKQMVSIPPRKMISRVNHGNAKVRSIFSRSQSHFMDLEKGTAETEKFVENSLQQLRELPMLTPLEPALDHRDDLVLPFSQKKSNSQGQFGDVFIENHPDHYRPNRRAPPIIKRKSLSALERRYLLCSNLLDRPPSLPSPPLMTNISERLNALHDDESIVSNSTLAGG